jgi:hypothetical protein
MLYFWVSRLTERHRVGEDEEVANRMRSGVSLNCNLNSAIVFSGVHVEIFEFIAHLNVHQVFSMD